MISGLEDITSGELRIGGRIVNEVPPARRGVAMVFQSYALYPHLTVRDNMGFGLKVRKVPADERARRVDDVARTLKLEALLDRFPRELSGGQRQRVAIGRAIAGRPEVFLFDEPLSNLDAELRVHMRSEIASLHKRLGNTMVYVTHDQIEAMTLADKIVVLRDGLVEQVGTPRELYERPGNLFVAGFIGSPKMNILPVGSVSGPLSGQPADATHVGMRPEDLKPMAAGSGLVSGKRAAQRIHGRILAAACRTAGGRGFPGGPRGPGARCGIAAGARDRSGAAALLRSGRPADRLSGHGLTSEHARCRSPRSAPASPRPEDRLPDFG